MSSLESTSSTATRAPRARDRRDELSARLAQHVTDDRAIASAHAIVDIVSELTDDDDILAGAMLFALLEANALSAEQAEALAGPAAARIGAELLRLGSLSLATPTGTNVSLSGNQAESLRKMLLAIVTDPRLVLIKLAAQLHKLRESKDAPEDRKSVV